MSAFGDGWISVAVALPDDETTVLAYGGGDSEPIWPAYVASDEGSPEWFTAEGAAATPEGVPGWGPVTHWRYMPEPPEIAP